MPAFQEIIGFIYKIMNFPLFPIGQNSKITATSILVFITVIAAFSILAKIITRVILKKILAQTTLDEGVQFTFTRITNYLMLVIGAIVAFQFIGVDLSGIVVILGFLSVGIGFGLQNLTSNFISGIMLLFERHVQIGDRVTVAGTEGDVEEINIRSTTVRTLNNVSIIVPNSEFISANVINWSHGDIKVRLDIDVGVSYDSDLDMVLKSLHEVADESKDVMKTPKSDVLLMSFGDSAWDMRLRIWIEDPKKYNEVRSDINCAIVRKFRANKIEIPFPQRDLHMRSPLPLPLASN
jgi:small-conductance mechanosensitive channel